MRGHRVQNKYTINFDKKIQEAMRNAKASPLGRGGIASAMTERLYKGKPALCSKARPFTPYRASGVQ